jgi:predicted permease
MPRWRRKKREQELERELRSDLELEAAEQQAQGLPPDAAVHAAHRALGNLALLKEDVREAWGWTFLDRLKQDLVYALRGMRRSPGFAATAVLSLALGIGANTAIFSLIDAVLLRWLPVRDPQGLVQIIIRRPNPEPLESFAYPLIRAMADHHEIFSSLCGFSSGNRVAVRRGDSVESAPVSWVTGGYYATLGLQPAAGRLLEESDDRLGAVPVAVITDDYWQREFGRRPDAIGRPILVEGTPVTIVGVAPAGFSGANIGETDDLTIPVAAMPQIRPDWNYMVNDSAWWLRVLARPQPGVTHEQAKARLTVVWNAAVESMIAAVPPDAISAVRRRMEGTRPDVIPGGTGWTNLRRQFRRPLLVLMAVAGLLLLIACANLANLLLARAAARQREIAVRLAIGANRALLVRQLLTEALLLSGIGASAGVLLAWAGSRILVNLLSSGQAHGVFLDVRPDWLVLAFAAGMACVTGVLFGIAPAFRGTRVGPSGALREKAAIASSRLAPLLVSAQVSLALLLLISAGLFVETLRNLHRVDSGFRGDGVLLAGADAVREGYRGPAAAAFYDGLLQEIERLPGVQSASYSMITPLQGGGITQDVLIDGRPVSKDQIYFNAISRGYFQTLGTPVLLGREFTARDTPGAPPVSLVNQAFARRYLREGSPLGRQVTVGGFQGSQFQVAGVVKDAVYETLWVSPPPTVFIPVLQRKWRPTSGFGVTFEAHVSGSLASAAQSLRAALQSKLPGSAVEVHALTEQVERGLVRERLMATLAASFGILGLVLAAVGLYGLLTYTVARRTNEIGIRLALGATRRAVLWMIIRHVLALLGIGITIGIPVAWAASRFVSSMLFGMKTTDLWTISAATVTLTAAGLVAGFLPAFRASRVDAMVALRYE